MNSEYEKRLETEIDRELKALPDLTAPPALSARVLAVLGERAKAPWYCRSWQEWPVGLKTACLALFLAIIAGFCFGLWFLPSTPQYAGIAMKVGGWFSLLGTIWSVLGTVSEALVIALKQLGTGFLAACFAFGALVWVLCLGLGTATVRLALARR